MLYFGTMNLQFTSQIFHESKMYVAYSPESDLSSCATTEAKAQRSLIEAVRLFLEEAEKKGSLQQILKEAGASAANSAVTAEILTVLKTRITVIT